MCNTVINPGVYSGPQLDYDSFETAFMSRKSGQDTLTVDGSELFVGKELGAGGTKTVYDARLGSDAFALALPNTTDGPEKAFEKWQSALDEPRNTDRLRRLGFLVNTTCEVLPVQTAGVSFPAIRMTRYQDLPWDVRDGKNRHSSVFQSELFDGVQSVESVSRATAGVGADIGRLLRHGVRPVGDSFNTAVTSSGLHSYFNDLAVVKEEPFAHDEASEYAKWYANMALDKLANGLSDAEWRRALPIIDDLDNKEKVARSLTQIALSTATD